MSVTIVKNVESVGGSSRGLGAMETPVTQEGQTTQGGVVVGDVIEDIDDDTMKIPTPRVGIAISK